MRTILMYTGAMDEQEPLALLRRAGLRSTPQRLAIVREVYARSHPSVGEIYDAVRQEFPSIGLATVYNTLGTMTEKGLVAELPFTNVTRFEINARPHANLVCRTCGEIEDCDAVEEGLLEELLSRVAGAASFRPESQRIDIYGLCRNCATA
jgi:Fur family transcriptional regulator, peroxide stress response regulator